MKYKKFKKRGREISIGEFFKITKEKTIIDFFISIVLVLILLLIIPDIRVLFLKEGLIEKLGDVFINFIIFMIIFYPLSCLISLYRRKR